MPQHGKWTFQSWQGNHTMMLHIAKDNFKVFLATKRNQIQHKLSAQPLKEKRSRKTRGNSFPGSISPRPMQEWAYNEVYWTKALSSRHYLGLSEIHSALACSMTTPLLERQQYPDSGCLIPRLLCNKGGHVNQNQPIGLWAEHAQTLSPLLSAKHVGCQTWKRNSNPTNMTMKL